MLNFKKKLEIFTEILGRECETPYIDDIYESIYMYSENMDFDFLNKLNSRTEIENWVDVIKSKIIMHEHEDGVENIFNDYVHA